MNWITREPDFDILEGANFCILRTVATIFGVHQVSYALGSGDFSP